MIKFLTKVAQISSDLFGYFEKHHFKVKTAATTFWANFWKILATFYSNIWSLSSLPHPPSCRRQSMYGKTDKAIVGAYAPMGPSTQESKEPSLHCALLKSAGGACFQR